MAKRPIATINPPKPLGFASGMNPGQINWAGIPVGGVAEQNLVKAGYSRPGGSTGGTPAPVVPPPVSLTAGAQVNAAGATLGTTLAGLQNQSDQASIAYGYNPDGTPNTSSPYSRAALLRQSYEQQQRRSLNSASNIYGGHYQNLQNIAAKGLVQGSSQLQAQYQSLLNGLAQRRQAAQTAATNAVSIARANAADQGFTS